MNDPEQARKDVIAGMNRLADAFRKVAERLNAALNSPEMRESFRRIAEEWVKETRKSPRIPRGLPMRRDINGSYSVHVKPDNRARYGPEERGNRRRN